MTEVIFAPGLIRTGGVVRAGASQVVDAGADDRLADNKRRVADQKLVERQTYRQVFELIDADDSGTIDAAEIRKVMKLVSKSADNSKFWDNYMDYRKIDFDRESDGWDRLRGV